MDESRWEESAVKDGQQLYLEQAEAVLFRQFCKEVSDGQYYTAGEIVGLMKQLSLV